MAVDMTARLLALSKGSAGGIPYTQADKDKLDAITNPMLIKGTVADMAALNAITDAKPGWVFFVGDGKSDFEEYVCTENGTWEYIGSSDIDLADCIKKTDIPTSSTAAGVRINTNNGIGVNPESGTLYIVPASEDEINNQSSNRKPIVPERLPYVMSSYGIKSKEQIVEMRAELDECVKKTDYASADTAGVVKVNPNYGITMSGTYPGVIVANPATENEALLETNFRKPLVPSLIPVMMSGYGIKSKEQIPDMQASIQKMTLKKKVVTGNTTPSGNLLIEGLTSENAILSVTPVLRNLIAYPYTAGNGQWYLHIASPTSEDASSNITVTVEVYYYELQEDAL